MNYINKRKEEIMNKLGDKSRQTKDEKRSYKPNEKLANIRQCKICGCTDDDCSACIENTGHPCTWVNNYLCSACVPSFGRL
jgi:hypothetical protein